MKIKNTGATVRAKWKSLRDKYRTTLASIPKPRSGDRGGLSCKVQWTYFASLGFLKDQFTPRLSTGNLPETRELDDIDPDIDLDDGEDGASQETNISTSEGNEDSIEQPAFDVIGRPSSSQSSTAAPFISRPSSSQSFTPTPLTTNTIDNHTPANTRKHRATVDIGSQLIHLEQQKLQYLEDKKNQRKTVELGRDDEDLNFFKSLLPHVSKLSPLDKMAYRMRVLQVTQEFLGGHRWSSNNNTINNETGIANSPNAVRSVITSFCDQDQSFLTTL